MAVINAYATLVDYKGIQDINSVDASDDTVIEQLLESASRIIDEETIRTFYPRVETRYVSVPPGGAFADELWLDDDLLEVISVTNGDGVAVTSTDYNLKPRNSYPKYCIDLKDSASVYWTVDSDGNSEDVIAVNAFWGCHTKYVQRAWTLATLSNAAHNATTTTLTVDSGTTVIAGNIIKIDNEIMIVSSTTPTTIIVMKRGDNGSTAATHLDDAPVYLWRPMTEIRLACLEIVKSIYNRRFGVNTQGVATVTAVGVVVTPEEIPATAWKIIEANRRLTWG